MLRYQDIADHEIKFLALTGLTRAEFQQLVPAFTTSFADALRTQTLEGYDRIGRPYTTYRNSPLPTIEDKLLFILVYLKHYPTQTVQGQLFGLSQSNANTWIHLLHPVLNHALALGGHLPERTAVLANTPEDMTPLSVPDTASLFFTMGPNDLSTDPVTRTNRVSTTAARNTATRSKTSS